MPPKNRHVSSFILLFVLFLLSLAGSAHANILLSPSSVNYGTTTVGTPIDRTFSATNNEDEPITFVRFESVPSGYGIVDRPAFEIDPNHSDFFTIRLLATSPGTYSGFLVMRFRGVNTGHNYFEQVSLTGTVEPLCTSSPTVNMTKPGSGATVSPNGAGNVILEASASDLPNGILRVDFFVDGLLVASDSSDPYAYAWPAKDGSHQVYARAINNCGNATNSSTRSFTVNCGSSSVTLTQPADGSTVTPNALGKVILKATASHSTGIASVKFFVDGNLVATDQTSPYAYAWPATSGTHEALARAFSVCGGAGTTSNRSDFTVP